MVPVHAAAFTLEVHGGWSRHAMGAMNDSLRSLNADIGTDLGPIRGGPSWGIGLRQWAGPDLLMRLEFEKLSSTTEDPVVRVSPGALVWSVSGTWFMPATARIRCGLGIGVGSYHAWGEIAGLGISGHDLGGRVAAETILPIGKDWSLQGAAGYRKAQIRNLNVGTATTDITADYSGAFLRIGIATDRPPPPRVIGP
jgi:hypothetical protein